MLLEIIATYDTHTFSSIGYVLVGTTCLKKESVKARSKSVNVLGFLFTLLSLSLRTPMKSRHDSLRWKTSLKNFSAPQINLFGSTKIPLLMLVNYILHWLVSRRVESPHCICWWIKSTLWSQESAPPTQNWLWMFRTRIPLLQEILRDLTMFLQERAQHT